AGGGLGLAGWVAAGPAAQAVAASAHASRAAVVRAGIRRARGAGFRSQFPRADLVCGRTGRAGTPSSLTGEGSWARSGRRPGAPSGLAGEVAIGRPPSHPRVKARMPLM